MIDVMISMENLIEILKTGGKVKTGVDVYNPQGRLLLSKATLVDRVSALEELKSRGLKSLPVNYAKKGGLWDGNGRLIKVSPGGFIDLEAGNGEPFPGKEGGGDLPGGEGDIEKQVSRINEIKKQAEKLYVRSRTCIKKAVEQIRLSRGEFDVQKIESCVGDLNDFLDRTGHPLSGLNREIFFHEEYFYTHAVNTCVLGTLVVRRFNRDFSQTVDRALTGTDAASRAAPCFTCYFQEDLNAISLGMFLYDLGKSLVPKKLLDKPGRLTRDEFDIVRRHSFDHGVKLLEKNRIHHSMVKNIVAYHHGPLYPDEPNAYPLDKDVSDIPLYVKIAKLTDIYDAMTSRTPYTHALDQAWAVTEMVRKYRQKDTMIQYILKAFVKTMGIYPPGSILYLKTGQMAYVLGGKGPLVLPFTDRQGNTLKQKADPVRLAGPGRDSEAVPDTTRGVKRPVDVYSLLPSYLKTIATA
ncbi:HD-GYP domain-containing protein [Desulfospira joergensenii]|uniref:HD-GYP domain-containing protein n=1 Tax=Desulfospira joergensenii TaxID=53329 RepID=UPI0003B38129|nr:HD domain-containing phosphohydrolase [Desulfospira joergensenii]